MLSTDSYRMLVSNVTSNVGSRGTFLSMGKKRPTPLTRRDCRNTLGTVTFRLRGQGLGSDITLVNRHVTRNNDVFARSTVVASRIVSGVHHISPLTPLRGCTGLDNVRSTRRLFPNMARITMFSADFRRAVTPRTCLCNLP